MSTELLLKDIKGISLGRAKVQRFLTIIFLKTSQLHYWEIILKMDNEYKNIQKTKNKWTSLVKTM